MLKISRKVEYALIALRHLQGLKKEELASAKELADSYGVPKELLAKVLQRLAKKNIVDAVKGPHGGYRLAIDPERMKLTEFFVEPLVATFLQICFKNIVSIFLIALMIL